MTLCVVVEQLLLFVKQFVLMRLGMGIEIEMGGLERGLSVKYCIYIYIYNVYKCSAQNMYHSVEKLNSSTRRQ